MAERRLSSVALAVLLLLTMTTSGGAQGLLDGRTFAGMIGPVDAPDLKDSLFFDEGHFWSGICTRCGFLPGTYEETETPEGIRFTGTLESDSRGQFTYDGLVAQDGSIRVAIAWERRRWYWTTRREILFVGEAVSGGDVPSLSGIRQQMRAMDPDRNPICARF